MDLIPADGHVNPHALADLLAHRRSRASEVVGVRLYRGRPNPDKQATAAAANHRQTDAWERLSPLVTVVRRPLKYPADWPEQAASEKGIDVALAVDMVRLAMAGEYDVAILFSSDTDLMPAVETLIDSKLAHVEIAAWNGSHRLRLPGTQVPWCHWVKKAEYQSIQDPTNYALPENQRWP